LHPAFVLWVGITAHQASLLQAVDPVGHGAGCDQGGVEETARAETVGRPLAPEGGKDVEGPRLQAVRGERGPPCPVGVPGQPRDAAQDLERADVKIGAFCLPGGDEIIHLVTRRAAAQPGHRAPGHAPVGAAGHDPVGAAPIGLRVTGLVHGRSISLDIETLAGKAA
jgi:hypothetical protein